METASPHHLFGRECDRSQAPPPILSASADRSLRDRKKIDGGEGDRSKQVVGSQTLGVIGEELAYHFLSAKGYKILLKNYECALGEIDLVAKEKGVLVFIEVKTRRSEAFGSPLDSITRQKRHQIVKTAQYYLKRYGIKNVACRFDVVSILILRDQEPAIEVIQNAFQEGD